MEGTQTVRHHHTGSRPHIQGASRPLRVRHSAQNLTDGAGLVLVRKLFDRFGLAGWIDGRAEEERGFFRPGLMTEVWIALQLYGGGVMDDLPLLDRRGVRRIFGWVRVPDPTTFGRWLRRASGRMVPLLDEFLWRMVRQRWALAGGVPKKLTLMLDSTVVVRYGQKQAGAEKGYNPKKRGRRSHHPLVAFSKETGDCLGVRWRAGNAHTAEGATEWLEELVGRLKGAGVGEITVRLDKGFISREMVETLQELDVLFLLKVPRQPWLEGFRKQWHHSRKGEDIFPEGEELWSATGSLWGARLLTIQTRKPLRTEEGTLDLDTYEVGLQADVLTNIPGIHALTAWRRYNAGAVVEHRIEELGQLSAGKTAVNDLGGNALLWGLSAVTYQTLHTLRRHFLTGSWRTAQPKRIRLRVIRLPAKLTTHARKTYLQLLRNEPVRLRTLAALRGLNHDIPPPTPA